MRKQGLIVLRVLAMLLLVATLLTACSGGGAPADTSSEAETTEPFEAEEATAEESTTAPIEAESTSGECGNTDDEIAVEVLALAEDGSTAYTVVIPSDAAVWERTAADAVIEMLLGAEAEAEAVADRDTALSDKEIVIGYTNRTGELPADFFDLGQGGYHLRVVGDKLFIGANSEAGMTAALERLRKDLHTASGGVFIEVDYVCRAVDSDTDSKPVSELTGIYGPTISYAQQVAGGVQAGYSDANRQTMTMTNLTMSVLTDMSATDDCRVTQLTNPLGVPYLTDTMDAYVVMGDGSVHYSSASYQTGRLNIYRYGSYYYETHILGTDFGNARENDPDSGVAPYDVLAAAGRSFTGNNASCGLDRETGHLVMEITKASDPSVTLGGTYSVPTDTYDALQVTVKTQHASAAQVYIATGESGGLNSKQMTMYSVSPDGEFHTYVIPLGQMPDYTGSIVQIRLDFDGQKGEVIEIAEVQAIKTRSTGVPAITIDRTLHTYSDKLHHAFQLVTTDEVVDLEAYGMDTRLDASRVRSLLVIDKNGEHTTLDGVDWDTAVCVAFDVANAGVFGYVLTTAENNGKLTVTLEDGAYVIRQQVTNTATLAAEENLYFGQRIYTDMTHDFDGVRRVCREERSPLAVTLTSEGTGAVAVGYEPLRGAYRFNVDGTGFNEAFYDDPQQHYRVDAKIEGDEADRTVYVYTHTDSGCLECAVVLGEDQTLLPVAVQVGKNFCGEHEEPVFDKGDASYGEAYFPLSVGAGESVAFTVLNLYQNWGIYPLKQISSIQFVAPYYHLSTGVTETNCIAPYYVFGKDLWTLPDFRAMSAPMWSSQPQHTSAGQLYFLEYTDSLGNYSASENTVDVVDSYGPVYADITMDYLSDDGRIAATYRHLEMPQTDENRTYYEIRLTVLEDITFTDFKNQFSIFSMDGRFGFYEELAYLDEHDQVVQTAPNETTRVNCIKLGSEAPFVSYSRLRNSGNFVNMALILKDWDVVLGGETYTGGFVFLDRAVQGGDLLNYCTLTMDLGEVTLKAGDTISVDMILMPWGSELTAKEDISGVLQVRQDTCLAPYTVTAATGTVMADTYMAKVRAENDTAEFTLSGGHNNMAVRVYGLSDYTRPVIQELVDGEWVAYNTASNHGYDGYMTYYDGDGTFSGAFIVPMTNGAERTFRVR